MYGDTVTFFCFYHSMLGDMWYPSVLHNVDLNMDKAHIIAKYGEGSADNAILHVKYHTEYPTTNIYPGQDLFPSDDTFSQEDDYSWVTGKVIMIGNKQWLPPKIWDAQTNDQLSSTLTFTDRPTKDGDMSDFFWFGDWGNEEPIADDDMQWGRSGFYNYMNSRYDYVFTITSVGGPYSVIPHFEILAK